MTIYEVVGRTARIDWADTSKRITLGFYSSEKSANALIDEMKQEKHWKMDWDLLTIYTHIVKD